MKRRLSPSSKSFDEKATTIVEMDKLDVFVEKSKELELENEEKFFIDIRVSFFNVKVISGKLMKNVLKPLVMMNFGFFNVIS